MTKVLGKYILEKSFWLYFFTFLIAPSGYLIKMFLSRSLSVEELGAFYGFLSLLTFLTTYNDFGLTQSLSYFVPKYKDGKQSGLIGQLVYTTLGFQLLGGVLVAVILFSLKNRLVFDYFQVPELSNIFSILIINFLLLSFFEVIVGFYMSIQDTFNHKLTETIKVWGALLGVIFFYYIGIGGLTSLQGYAISWTVGTITAILLGVVTIYYRYQFYFVKTEFNSQFIVLLKKFFSYSFWVFVGLNAGNISGSINIQMITYFLGSEQAGYYSIFNSLLQIPQLIVTPIFGFLFTLFSELHTNKESKKQSMLIEYLYKIFIILGFVVGGVFLIFGGEIGSTLFGIKYTVSGEFLEIIALFIPLYYLFSINFAVLPGLGQVKVRSFIIGIGVVINFLGNLIFIKEYGIPGVIISTLLSRGFCVIYSYMIINKRMNINFNSIFYLKNLIFIFLYFLLITQTGISQHIKQASGDLLLFIVLLISLAITLFIGVYIINHIEIKKFIKFYYNNNRYDR